MFIKNKYINFVLLAIVLGVAQNVAATTTDVVPRIIGGTVAPKNAYPFMVALERNSDNVQFCGGTLIAPNKVLTAGHCLVASGGIHIRAGTNNKLKNAGTVVKVANQVRHPKYDPNTLDYDVAVFTLAAPLLMTDGVNLIKLPGACSNMQCITGLAKPATMVRVIGWGSTATDGSAPSMDLMQVDIPLLDNQICGQSMVGITPRMICAGYDQGVKDSCFGDSGGPLFSYLDAARTGLQTGIVSWGHTTCAQLHTFGVYTRISNTEIRKFILDNSGI